MFFSADMLIVIWQKFSKQKNWSKIENKADDKKHQYN